MSRYKCWKCETEHETDNVVAVCIQCFDVACRRVAEAEARSKKFADAMDEGQKIIDEWVVRAEKAESENAALGAKVERLTKEIGGAIAIIGKAEAKLNLEAAFLAGHESEYIMSGAAGGLCALSRVLKALAADAAPAPKPEPDGSREKP